MWALSIYVVPIAIGLVSIAALVLWDDQYAVGAGKPLELQVFATATEGFTPADARVHVDAVRPMAYFDTRRSEAPIWFVFKNARTNGTDTVVEFPSRHAVDVACWDHATLRPLGEASRASSQGNLNPVKAGFALKLEQARTSVLCRASFVGPARLTAALWSADGLSRSVNDFQRKSGILFDQ